MDFILLRYSVLFTVESLSLLYLLFISYYIYSRWRIDKLGAFHAIQTSMCLDPVRLVLHLTGLSPPENILLTFPRRCCFDGSFMLFLSCFVMLSCTPVC